MIECLMRTLGHCRCSGLLPVLALCPTTCLRAWHRRPVVAYPPPIRNPVRCSGGAQPAGAGGGAVPGGAPVRRCRLASPLCTYKQRQQAPMQHCCMLCSPVSVPRIKKIH